MANEIYIHPDNSNIVWVSSNKGFFKSIDAGNKWTKTIFNNIQDFKIKPDNPDVIYAVSPSKFYRSTNGGDSFEIISEGLPDSSGRFAIDVSPADPEIIYLLSANIDNTFQGVYRSVDAGLSFDKTEITTDLFGGSTQAWYDMAITVNPNDASMVFVGVLDIWRSTDGGDSFKQMNRWWDPSEPSYTHADIHFLRYFNGVLYAGTDGGIYASDNNAVSFTDLTERLNISQYYKISTARAHSKKIVGGLQDNGGFAYSDSRWHQYHYGDGMDCAVDPNNEDVFYGFNQYGGRLNVTYNGGKTEGGSLATAPSEETDGENDHGGKWITPLAIDKQGNLFAGYSRVYQLVDNKWQALSQAVFGGDLDHIALAPSNDQVMYVSRANQLFKSSDQGLNFEKIDHSFSTVISSIDIHHQDENTVYVSTAGISGQILVSSDAGESWKDITYNLPGDSKLVIKHQNQSLVNDLYLGTSLGVYHINDQMNQWERYDLGLPNVPVYDLEVNINDQLLTAGTYGRGVWQSPIEVIKANNDISLMHIETNNSVQCDGISPVVKVKNNGLNQINSVHFKYKVDDDLFEHAYSGLIEPDEVKLIELPPNSNIAMGEHQLIVEADIVNDAFQGNNKLFASFITNQSSQAMYIHTFGDINDDEWLNSTYGSTEPLWQRALVSSPKMKDKFDFAYVTNDQGNYTDETTAYLISPCYDLSRLENPVIKFDMIFDIELNWDVLYMEFTTDNGTSWNILGSADDPNWYNSDFIDPQRPITVGNQWTGTQLEVKEYSHDLSYLQNEKNIIFRFVFSSDQAENGEGVAIDNFRVDASAILAVDDFQLHDFKLYPNPSASVFYIQRPGNEPLKVQVFDSTGKLVIEIDDITRSMYALDLKQVKPGLYFLKIREGRKQLATTLLKNRSVGRK